MRQFRTVCKAALSHSNMTSQGERGRGVDLYIKEEKMGIEGQGGDWGKS
jgi:hypothetical protein